MIYDSYDSIMIYLGKFEALEIKCFMSIDKKWSVDSKNDKPQV